MIPFQSLRLNSVYGGGNPLGLLSVRSPFLTAQERQNLENEENNKEQWNQYQGRMNAIADAVRQRNFAKGNPQPPQNVVLNPNVNGIDPLHNAELNLKNAQLGEKTANDQGKLSFAQQKDFSQGQFNNQKLQLDFEKFQADAKNNDTRTAIYAFKAEHPNQQIYAPKGGNIYLHDPVNGMIDTGVSSGTLSDKDRLDLMGQNAMNLEGARATAATNLETTRQTGRAANIAARGAQQRQTQAAKPVNQKPQTAADQRTQFFNRAQALMNDPLYGKYISPGQTAGTFQIDKSAPDDVFHAINQRIYNPNGIAEPGQDVDLPSDKGQADPIGILKHLNAPSNQTQLESTDTDEPEADTDNQGA